MWQKCPICNGTGRNNLETYTNNTSNPCNTCDAKGIISQLTGLPPKGVETFATPKYREDNDNISK